VRHPRTELLTELLLVAGACFIVAGWAHAQQPDNEKSPSSALDGQLGDNLDEHLKYLWAKYRNRFVVFANIGTVPPEQHM